MDTKIKVLFLEDEDTIREVLKEYMTISGYQVTEAEDGEQAVQLLENGEYDLAVLDIMVPGVDGFGVLEYIRQKRLGMGVIMLTALEDEASQVKAFNYFADDYVIKPVSPIILLKRMETIMRRIRQVGQLTALTPVTEETEGNADHDKIRMSDGMAGRDNIQRSDEVTDGDKVQTPDEITGRGTTQEAHRMTGGGAAQNRPERTERFLTVDDEAYTVYFRGKPLPLTLSEFLLFQALYEAPNRVFTREMLILRIYNEDYIGNDRIIDAHVKNLRKKLPVSCIRTVIGVGYRYDAQEEHRELP